VLPNGSGCALRVKGKNLPTNRIVGLYTETGFEILREM
jgi:hypothetical protein